MWSFKLAGILGKGTNPLSRWTAVIGGAAMVSLMLVIVVDVIGRATLRMPIMGSIEIVQVLLLVVIFGGMAYTGLKKGHVRVEILISKFSPTAKQASIVCANLVATTIVTIVAWRAVEQTLYMAREEYITGILEIPLWPFVMLTAVFLSIFAIVLLAEFLESLGQLTANRTKNWLLLIPGSIIAILLFLMSFTPSLFFTSGISPDIFGVVALLVLFFLIFFGVYIGAAMATIALWGMSILIAPNTGLAALGIISQAIGSSYKWSVAPMFMWMGTLVAVGALGKDLYDMAYKWVGRLPGGLASATAGTCGILAAAAGDSMTGVVTLTPMALPQMRAHKYSDKLATGTLCAASTVAWLIPPSLGFIVYGLLVEQSIGRLFMAGIFPGILMTLAFIVLITIRCQLNPALGPPGPATPFREKWASLKNGGPVLALFLLVMGGIYTGIFTPTEAGAIGAFAALITILVLRRLTWRRFVDSIEEALRMVSLVFFIFVYAHSLTLFMAITKLPFALAAFVDGLGVPPHATLIAILSMYLILGCVMNSLPVLILTLPIIFPTVVALGFDPIWFGVLIVIMIEIGQVTPPIGMNVFIMAGITDVPMYTIFRGVTPFWIMQLAVAALIIAFPQIALFLPNQVWGG